MAHQLKYYKEIDSHGHLWRVEILQETEDTLTPTEIGPVLQGLRLVMQGDQADVDTPIVKTSLEMTFVDAPDLEEERKCGYWEEFYTSSATEYQVRLYKDGLIEWTGYVTPDSFSEDLRYRGSVSIIARDNLGALQDYIFNAVSDSTGLISLYRLVSEGLSNAHFGMKLINQPNGLIPYTEEAERHSLDDILFNLVSFKGKTWYEAIEQALYSVGLVLRYIGDNSLLLVTIRDIPLLSKEYHFDVPRSKVSFCAHATRELSPAVKSINEAVKFEIIDNTIRIDADVNSYTEESALISYDYDGYLQNPQNNTAYNTPVYGYNTIGYGLIGADAENSRVLNPFAYKIDFEHSSQEWGPLRSDKILYVLCNTFKGELRNSLVETNPLRCSVRLQYAGKFTVQYKFAPPIALYNNREAIGNFAVMDGYAEAYAERYAFRAKWEGDDGQILYLVSELKNGMYYPSWKNKEQEGLADIYHNDYIGYECEAFPELITSSAGRLTIDFYGGAIVRTDLRIPGSEGVYIRLTDITIVDNQSNQEHYLLEQLRINTIYNKNNNIILNRTPEYANNPSETLSPSIINNGIYVLRRDNIYRGSEFWQFHKDDAKQQLSTLIHQQILAYYAKPNNVLTGELVLEDDVPDFRSLWRWGGKDHVLMSGTLNVLTGRMESAVLREFTRYDMMWETWIENEDIKVDYSNSSIEVIVHSNRKLSLDSISGLPSWVTRASIIISGNYKHRYTLNVMENASGQERSAIFRIDTAYMRITQSAAGDYNIDYGTDYS